MRAEDLMSVADVLGTEIVDGELRFRIGDAAKAKGYSQDHGMYGLDGFISSPLPPDEDGSACQCIYLNDGHERIVVGTRDNRLREKVGAMAPGDRAVIGHGSARMLIKYESDTICFYAENAKADGQAMLNSMDAKNGVTLVQNGGAFMQMKKDEIILAVNGGGALRISADGVQCAGGAIQMVSSMIQLGDMGGGTNPPPSPTNAVAVGVAGPVNLVSTKVFVAMALLLVLFAHMLLGYRSWQ
jgi:hypothetical protein